MYVFSFRHFLFFLCSVGLTLLAEPFRSNIAVQDQDFPQLPKPSPKRQADRVFVEEGKALVLLAPGEPLLGSSERSTAQGLVVIGLDLPGPTAKLARRLYPYYHNKKVSQSTIQEIKEQIEEFYQEYHHPFVLIEVPSQNVSEGVIQLVIVETVVGTVKFKGQKWSNTKALYDYLSLQPNQPIQELEVYGDLNFFNQNPFRQADILYAPGTVPGTTDVTINLNEKGPFRIYAGADNTGVETTGRERLYTGFNYANVFNLAHVFSFQFTSSYDFNKFKSYTGQYLAPLSWGHVLNLYGGYSMVHSDLPTPSMRSSGFNSQFSTRYNIPFLLSRYLEQEGFFGFDWKRLNNTVEFVDARPVFGQFVNITQLVFGYQGAYERNTYRFDFDATGYWSPGRIFSDQTDENFMSLRPGAKNNWIYARGDFVYVQKLPQNFSFSLTVAGQLSSAPLLPTDQYDLGGWDTVRGYEEHAYNADNAFLGRMELRTAPYPLLFNKKNKRYSDAIQFLAFLDYGYGNNKIAVDPLPKSEYLLGIGPGVRYVIDPWLSTRLDWGIKLHNADIFGGGSSMIHFGVTLSY
ncbi:MAG: ShlB/FhaC/HecB family hemolysin secretion/activation protein [Chlamydiia bacterium]|nr:ShlB/FhaC/HecB family hemolysin secretion/activation protein [Chlamydiia bacterium]